MFEGEAISFSGRIDRVVALPDGTALIVDFKTGSGASTVNDKKLQEGDGLQLWLYARLWNKQKPAALCRLPPGGKVGAQAEGALELTEVSAEMKQVAQTGILGAKGEVWGRFGGEERLPIATWPQEKKLLSAKRKAAHE